MCIHDKATTHIHTLTHCSEQGGHSLLRAYPSAHYLQLLKFVKKRLALEVCIMAIYCVYVAYAVTFRGSRRVYVGSSYALEVRKLFHQVNLPCWLRACSPEEPFSLLIL